MSKLTVKDENYYVVQGWMRNKLGLRGNSLDIYAIIYGFSQVAHQEFTASINYLCEWLGVSRPTVINTLKDLVDGGYLTKESTEINGVIYNRYTAIVPDFTGGKETLLPQLKNFTRGSQNSLLNNNSKDTGKDNPLPTVEGEQAPSSGKTSYKDIYTREENAVIKDALKKFVDSCLGKNYTPRCAKVEGWAKLLRESSHNNGDLAMRIVQQSIDNGWKDLYPLKDKYKAEAVSKKWDGKTAKGADGKDIVY